MPYQKLSASRTALFAALSVSTFAAATFPTAVSAAPAVSPSCTITGTAGNDALRGTPGADVICGLGGNDIITGAGGNDVLDGGAGNDRLDGGVGNDRIVGVAGNDQVDGGVGYDTLVAGDGSDITNGGAGNDQVDGGAGNDAVSGGAGNDTLKGGAGSDAVNTGGGADICAADTGDRVAGACATDRTGPAISWIYVPSTVTAGTTFTAKFALADVSGIDPQSPAAYLGGTSGYVTNWCGFPVVPTQLSGTDTDSIWTISCAVPAQAVSGTYSLFLGAQDFFANSTWFSPGSSGKGDFTVVGVPADNQAPAITAVVVPNAATPGATLTFTWKASDTTGVAYATVWVYGPNGPVDASGAPVVDYGLKGGERVAGTVTDGSWSQTVTVPSNAANGDYSVWVSTADMLGNKTYEQYATFAVAP